MPMVRTDRNRYLAPLLHFKQRLHHAVHVHIPLKMVGLIEIPFLIAFCTAQMNKADTVAELIHH